MEITGTKEQYDFSDDDGNKLVFSGTALVNSDGKINSLSGSVKTKDSPNEVAFIQYNESDMDGNIDKHISRLNTSFSDEVDTFTKQIISDLKNQVISKKQ